MNFARKFRRLLGFENTAGSQIAEFAVCVPLLTIFAVGIFDFSGAFNLKQKLAGAAQEGALVAASEPTSDLALNQLPPPNSVKYVEQATFAALEDQGVLPGAIEGTYNCGSRPSPTVSNLAWTYTITGCPGTLIITIDRGSVPPAGVSPEKVIYTHVTVTYGPYPWQFNNVVSLVGGSAVLPTALSSDAYASNQS